MSIADSTYNLRFQTQQSLLGASNKQINGGSKQNSLSIQSGMHTAGLLKNSPSPVKLPGLVNNGPKGPQVNDEQKPDSAAIEEAKLQQLRRQESSFTQEEIYRCEFCIFCILLLSVAPKLQAYDVMSVM